MMSTDTTLGKMVEDQKRKVEKWEEEVRGRREEWRMLEDNYGRWEGRIAEREREVEKWEDSVRKMEVEMVKREEEFGKDSAWEFKVIYS